MLYAIRTATQLGCDRVMMETYSVQLKNATTTEGFDRSPAVRQGTLDLDFLGVNPADLSRLELPFKEEEIWEAIKEMPKEKAPGPDGYNITFYQRCWHIIKKDILEVFDCIHSRNCLAFDKVNGAHLVLLPKRPGAAVPNDIRPISLVHSLAKIVSKSWQEGWRLCSQASLAKIKGLF